MHQNHPLLVRSQSLSRNFECSWVAIDPDQPAGGQTPGNFDRVPAGADRGIHVGPLRTYAKPFEDLFEQNRRMQDAQNLDAQFV
jgi:hypothetical protein